jgi:large subunit ribosomal protein L4
MLAHRAGGVAAQARPVRAQRASTVAVRASGSAVQTVQVPVRSASTAAPAGTADLTLKVAGEDTAKGLVHRYLVYILQNARRVSSRDWIGAERTRARAPAAKQSCGGGGAPPAPAPLAHHPPPLSTA